MCVLKVLLHIAKKTKYKYELCIFPSISKISPYVISTVQRDTGCSRCNHIQDFVTSGTWFITDIT